MAGVYPDAPAMPRMAYDRDGTVGCVVNTSTTGVSALTLAQMQQLNDEDIGAFTLWDTSSNVTPIFMCLIFPELRDITHYSIHGVKSTSSSVPFTMVSSVDTTNGYDGTWLTVVNPWIEASNVADKSVMRTPTLVTANVSGIRAIRFNRTGGGFLQAYDLHCIHYYGQPSAGQNPNRLRLWHPTLNQEIVGAHFDYGDAARNSSADKQFRIKNNSATLTANTITVSLDAPTDASPTVPGQFLLEKVSAPGFTATVAIPTLAPNAISEIITLRRNTPTNAVMSLWWARVLASAATWT